MKIFWKNDNIVTEERARVGQQELAEIIKEALTLPTEEERNNYINNRMKKIRFITSSTCGLKLKKLARLA